MPRETVIDYQQYLASREWRVKRKEVIERQNGICQRCGSRPIENVHHITYENLGREDPDDLIGVCLPCHEYLAAERDDDPAVEAIIEAVGDGLFPVKDWGKKKNFTRAAFIGGVSDCGLALKVRFTCKDEQMLYASWLPRIEVGSGVMAIFDWV
jgi:hypothetical protein